jgi:hypothetical protein
MPTVVEPAPVRVIAWVLGKFALIPWMIGNGVRWFGGRIEHLGDLTHEGGYKLNGAAIWLLERYERQEAAK